MIGRPLAEVRQAVTRVAAVGVLAITSRHHRRCIYELGQRYTLAGAALLN